MMVSFYVMLTGLLSSSICEGEEELDCTVLAGKYAAKAQEIANSITSGSTPTCSELNALYDSFFTLLRDGKNCESIKAAIEAAGYGTVDDLIAEYQSYLDTAGC